VEGPGCEVLPNGKADDHRTPFAVLLGSSRDYISLWNLSCFGKQMVRSIPGKELQSKHGTIEQHDIKQFAAQTTRMEELLQRADQEKYVRDEALRMPTDFLVSLMCGCSSVVFLSNPARLKKDFAESPLIPGKSIVYECMCGDMETAFNQHVDPRVLSEGAGDDDTIVTFQTLVHNCRIRSDYIRARAADGSNRPDVVPYPGLDGMRR
jgi:hypothetical protein